jgi:hypothetical protein
MGVGAFVVVGATAGTGATLGTAGAAAGTVVVATGAAVVILGWVVIGTGFSVVGTGFSVGGTVFSLVGTEAGETVVGTEAFVAGTGASVVGRGVTDSGATCGGEPAAEPTFALLLLLPPLVAQKPIATAATTATPAIAASRVLRWDAVESLVTPLSGVDSPAMIVSRGERQGGGQAWGNPKVSTQPLIQYATHCNPEMKRRRLRDVELNVESTLSLTVDWRLGLSASRRNHSLLVAVGMNVHIRSVRNQIYR